ncbi:MAG: Ribonucleoside-diphosphate reductase [Candidatus Roizmanbacteria bacterium GW2011_GWC2_34_23]|uniref:Ribonucleoside-diphosphate reductase n=2 Tax=Candidatus Roizmaniibacteriota TaxID=1752723 RepID=A0A0G0AXU6_9BACT|nr:MAG: Ribonucleoside-diphosphate reductase [Candidatus Roizmanbacteria bacterium GW2011_GWC2_34_23]
MKLKGISEKVFLDRYSLKNKEGKAMEKRPEEMWARIAKAVSVVEKKSKQKKWEKEFYSALKDFKYVPGGRILSGAGTGYDVSFYNCFVIPSPEDSRGGILKTLGQMVEIMARGGGVGINLSSLRPRGARVKKVNGFSSGPINWAELFSVATRDIIQQGGTRRGALMLMLWDWHPDIEEFITVKQDLSKINGANLSLCVSDTFMEAVEKDSDWPLVFPDIKDPEYDRKWTGDLDAWKKMGKKVIVHKIVKARKLWDLVASAAWKSAEPGVVFMERYNKLYNNYYWNKIICVNPCVTGDTLVNTTNGLITMKKLYEKRLPFRVVVNGKDYLSTAVKLTGKKQIYRLITKEGYQLRLTADHKVFTPFGKKSAGELKKGEKIILATGGYFGTKGTLDEGRVLGWLVGDGSIKKDVVTLYFYQKEKQELAPRFALMVEKMVEGEQVVARPYHIAPQYIEKENKTVIESVRLWRIAYRYGLSHENKYQVPEAIFAGSEGIQRGFLQGIFSSDGTVIGTIEKGVSIRLTSIKKSLLISVQRLLLNFGIFSKIYENRRQEGKRFLPDGRGGLKLYNCQAYHELVISKENLIKFSGLVGFLQQEKQNKLQSFLSLYRRGPYKEKPEATFLKLEKEEIEEVFDITVEGIHGFSANGLLVSNCGEEGLPPWGVCNLGSINLSALVKGKDIDEKGKFDFNALKNIVRIAVRFQDNVVDMDPYIFEGIRKTQLEGERRIGLGTMGLGDTLIKLHLRYGSPESLEFIDYAREKGSFVKYDRKLYLEGKFVDQLPDDVKKSIKKNGIRNSLLLMQAPTGSTSLMAGTTSGIEPVYEFEFIRKDRIGTHIIRHDLYDSWFKKHSKEVEAEKVKKPEWFVSANELTPEDHVKVQGVIQKYVDASISKTVNAPTSHTVEDVKKLYNLAYKLGCKGIAYMRDGSRPGVLERKPEPAEAKTSKQVVCPPPSYTIKPRPMVVHGATYRINTPVGIAFITLNTNGGNPPEPLEIFINVGKAGSDVYAMAEGLGRMISVALRFSSHISVFDRVNEIITQLQGIGGARTMGFGKDRIRSLPDAVAKVLSMHYGMNGEEKPNGVVKEDPKLVTATTQPSLIQPAVAVARSTSFDICPSCGEVTLVHEEGCKKCYGCGYSEC